MPADAVVIADGGDFLNFARVGLPATTYLELGVSRQPVQQALMLLRRQGVLRDAPGRGLLVAPLDLDYVRQMYEMRAMIEGLAFRKAAERNAADVAFHAFIYRLSENRLIVPAMETHWTRAQRVMGEVLMRDEQPRNIWDQHQSMLNSVARGDGDEAERLARQHILEAAEFMIGRLQDAVPESLQSAP